MEWVVGNIRKKYSLLSATQPIEKFVLSADETTTLDKSVCVACALINMRDSVILKKDT